MAFNKTKTLETAQKYLNQGKFPQAIVEYQQILRHEPKDQVTLMTVGDLYVRAGDTTQAIRSFDQLAQLYLGDGFTTKAIAIYKKITKLAPEETNALERLGELYVQQGVMSEARPVYLQLAEAHLKGSRQQQAVTVLRKLLDLEPDNLRVQVKLAELYQAIGQKPEAALAFLNSAHRMFDKGDFNEAKKMADRALSADARNTRAVTVKARAVAALGAPADAVALLEELPEGAGGPDTSQLLCDLYLQSGQAKRAVAYAERILSGKPENYASAYGVTLALLEGGEGEVALGLLGRLRPTMAAAGDYERLGRALNAAVERLSGRVEPLEWLVEHCRQTKDAVRLPEALDQLGEAATASGQLERAKQIFEELLELDPEQENNRRRLNQVRVRLGLEPLAGVGAPAPVEVTAETPQPFAAEVEPVPETGVVEAGPDEETQRFINQALTDVDLFSSYGLTQKAIDLLEGVLQRAPRHTATLEKLLDLHLGAGHDRRTAELAAQLEQIHRQKGEVTYAEKFAELQRRFQRVAGITAEEAAAAAAPQATPAEFTIPTVEAEATAVVEGEAVAEVKAEPAGASAVHEVDLSEEWAAMAVDTPAPAEAPPAEVPAEEAPVAAAPEAGGEEAEMVIEEPKPAVEPAAAETEEAVEYELELTPPAPAAPVAKARTGAEKTTEDFLADLVEGVEGLELGPAPGKAGAPKAAPGESVEQLKEVFDEFRAELGEEGQEAEDPETHYNLGIAYREMGLLEESIGEFQKVAKETEKGRAFRYKMQCYTLLGLCFMDKGQPQIATVWYQKALQTEGLEQESILALRYDLGVAQAQAGNTQGALDSFSQVYAVNIDYRDVADRIAALQKAR